MTGATHADIRRMMEYVAGHLREDEERQVERHVADCDECAALGRQLHELYWTVRSWRALGVPEESYEPPAARLALRQAEAEYAATEPELAARIRRWWSDLEGRGKGTLRVVVPRGGEMGKLVTDGLATIRQQIGQWSFEVAVGAGIVTPLRTGAVRTRGAVRARGGASGAGAPPALTGARIAAAEDDEGREMSVTLEPASHGPGVAVVVRTVRWPAAEVRPLCVLREGPRHVATKLAPEVGDARVRDSTTSRKVNTSCKSSQKVIDITGDRRSRPSGDVRLRLPDRRRVQRPVAARPIA